MPSSRKPCKTETIATLPGGWRSVHTIRLEIEPFAELVAHSESLTGSQVDSPDSCRVKLKSASVTVLQSPFPLLFAVKKVMKEINVRKQRDAAGFFTNRRSL